MNPATLLAVLRTWWKLCAGLILGFILCWPVASCSGRHAERTEWEAATARLQAQITERAREADNQRQTELSGTNASITQAREELDNATRNLPDESPSARRRARICRELREQAARDHSAPPAC